jgi:Skp family chaperone for outer membrane proteins
MESMKKILVYFMVACFLLAGAPVLAQTAAPAVGGYDAPQVKNKTPYQKAYDKDKKQLAVDIKKVNADAKAAKKNIDAEAKAKIKKLEADFAKKYPAKTRTEVAPVRP